MEGGGGVCKFLILDNAGSFYWWTWMSLNTNVS